MNFRRFLILSFALLFAWQNYVLADSVKGRRVAVEKIGKVAAKETKPATEITYPDIPEGPFDFFHQLHKFYSGTHDPVRVPSSHVPRVSGLPAPNSQASVAASFQGVVHLEQRLANGGKQFSKEPPDTHVAVSDKNITGCGNPCVVEVVNTVIRVYDPSGTILSTKTLHQFFGQVPEVDRGSTACNTGAPGCYGPGIFDPMVYYDPPSDRWFVSVTRIDRDSQTAAELDESYLMLAVSTSDDPSGSYYVYLIDTDNDGTDGTPSHPDCPCFGDQPLIGADANALFISTNEFGLAGGFNGAQIYAIGKAALIAGSTPNSVLFSPGSLAEGIAYSVYPAVTPPGGAYQSGNGGTEFFTSALDFFDTLDNRIAVWAMTNTSTIGGSPDLHLTNQLIDTEVYGAPPKNEQPEGPRPLADCLEDPACAGNFTGIPDVGFQVAKPQVDSGGDRMRQSYYTGTADNKLWTSLTTVVKTANGPARAGIAVFAFTPILGGTATSPTVDATVARQGYLAVNNQGIHYPAVAVNASGQGIVSFTLTGLSYYPAAAFAKVSVSGIGGVQVARFGLLPFDGFTGYFVASGLNRPRWGDYSGAAIDGSGNAWLATERIGNAARNLTANWETRIAKVNLP
jgi:hypothetical protein